MDQYRIEYRNRNCDPRRRLLFIPRKMQEKTGNVRKYVIEKLLLPKKNLIILPTVTT